MPIIRREQSQEFVLRCVNKHDVGPAPDTTMRVSSEEAALPYGNFTSGIRLNFYVCSVCRYVELYVPKT